MIKSFKNYIVYDSNQEVYNLANKIAKEETIEKNLFIIYGPHGSGKSHLLDGIWHYYVQNSRKHPEWMSHQGFEATIEKYNYNVANISNFKEISLLLIDDMDFVDDKRNGGFICEVLEKLMEDGKQICLTCTQPPNKINKPELVSLFSKGICAELKSPTKQEQKDFYKQMSKAEGVDIYNDNAYEYLCEKQKDYRTMKSEIVRLRYCLIRDNLETASLSMASVKKYLNN